MLTYMTVDVQCVVMNLYCMLLTIEFLLYPFIGGQRTETNVNA